MLAIPIIQLLKDKDHQLQLEILAGDKGLGKKITVPRIQKPGLAMTGDVSHLHPGRVQVLGKSEIRYLIALPPAERKKAITTMCKVNISCFVITNRNEPVAMLSEACKKNGIPLLRTSLLTSTFINRVTRFLEDQLTASTSIHGVLMDVYGIGVMIIGKSGIGKSECALDLIIRGHRLVADDIVNIKKKPPSTLYGMGSEIIKYHMEIRGLGIINIKDLFGVAAIRDRKLLEIVVELHEWDSKAEYDRLGIEEKTYTLLDVHIPYILIPVRPGRNITTIIEVAARNHILKMAGHHSAREFHEHLTNEISARTPQAKTAWEMLE